MKQSIIVKAFCLVAMARRTVSMKSSTAAEEPHFGRCGSARSPNERTHATYEARSMRRRAHRPREREVQSLVSERDQEKIVGMLHLSERQPPHNRWWNTIYYLAEANTNVFNCTKSLDSCMFVHNLLVWMKDPTVVIKMINDELPEKYQYSGKSDQTRTVSTTKFRARSCEDEPVRHRSPDPRSRGRVGAPEVDWKLLAQFVPPAEPLLSAASNQSELSEVASDSDHSPPGIEHNSPRSASPLMFPHSEQELGSIFAQQRKSGILSLCSPEDLQHLEQQLLGRAAGSPATDPAVSRDAIAQRVQQLEARLRLKEDELKASGLTACSRSSLPPDDD